jgi:predicted dehydrogenase
MSSKYKVVVVGMGKRGMHHAQAFQCDVDRARLDAAAAKFGAAKGTDALQVALETKPDVFCFCTLPKLRSQMIRAGLKSGAQLIAFEKPVALNTREGVAARKPLSESGIKAVERRLDG